ncbi:hypothetical protein FRC07_008426 [Ceratobasidium sp. 392]|nr:hypothetical protein FRC07_008426 [Ceratobasidium sp. 392]
MTSQRTFGDKRRVRHRLQEITLVPDKSTYEVLIEIHIDGHKIHKLPPVKKGQLLCWTKLCLPCDVSENSLIALQIAEVQPFKPRDRVGRAEYQFAQLTRSDNDVFSVQIKILDEEAASISLSNMFILLTSSVQATIAYSEASKKVQHIEKQPESLEKAEGVGDAFKLFLKLGRMMADLDPTRGAKIMFSVCTRAWEHLEQQGKQDAELNDLVRSLARMIPSIESVQVLANDNLRETVLDMLNLIEDVSLFILNCRSRSSFKRALRSAINSDTQEQTQTFIGRFKQLRHEFDTRVGVQLLQAGEADRIYAKLKDLKPVDLASYDHTRQCIPGTREKIIEDIIVWAQADRKPRLAWIHGLAGFGKSSIATSVCCRLDEQQMLACSFFCKRDNAELRDPRRALMTISYELALRWETYAKAIGVAMCEDPGLCSRHLQHLCDALVNKPLQTLVETETLARPLVIVVDALDECGDTIARKQLLACLRNLSRFGLWLKVAVTSRPDADISEFFGGLETDWFTTFDVLQYDASADIRIFVQDRLDGMKNIKNWPEDAVERITLHSSGLFIWARTACKFITDGYDRCKRLEQVLAGTELADIDYLYSAAVRASILDRGDDNGCLPTADPPPVRRECNDLYGAV